MDIDLIHSSILSAAQASDWQQVALLSQKMRETAPDDPRGYLEDIVAQRHLGNWSQADAVAEEGLARLGERRDMLIAYGDTAMDSQRWEEALIRWKRYRLQEPKDLYGYSRGAEALLRLNKEEEAAELYRRGLIFVEIGRNGIERFDQLEIAFPPLMPEIANLQVIKKLQDFRSQWIEPKDLAAYFRKLGKSLVSQCQQEYGRIINAAEVAGCELTDQQNFTLEIPSTGFSLDTFTLRNCSNFSIRMDQAADFLDCAQQHNLHGLVVEGCTNFVIYNLKIASARNPVVISQCSSFIIDECQINDSRGCGVIVHGSTRFMLRDSLFERNLSAGINLIGDCQDAIIEGCQVADGKGYFNWDAGLNICATSYAIKLEHIPDSYHEALPLLEKKAAPLRIQIRNCEFSDNRAQGIYLEGAQNCHLTHNRILKNNKEGICFDWGTAACVLESNALEENGYRAKVGEFEARVDFIEGVPVLEDGSSVCKLPAISLDNAALNLLRKNRIVRNYGGGVKTVRTAIWNRIEDNDIIGNAHAGHILDRYHFHGVCLLGLKDLGGEFSGESDTRADLSPSLLNMIINNSIDDQHRDYFSPHSFFNFYMHPHRLDSFKKRDGFVEKLGFNKEILQKIYEEKRCILLANGPSLLKYDPHKIKKYFTIGVNHILRTKFIPDLICISDPNRVDYENLRDTEIPVSTVKHVFEKHKKLFESIKNLFKDIEYHFPLSDNILNRKSLERDLRKIYWGGSVVTDLAVPLAAALGFEEIYIVGLDGVHASFPSSHSWGNDKAVDTNPPNVLHATHQHIRYLMELDGVKIFNASSGGVIEAFERKSLPNLMINKSQEKNLGSIVFKGNVLNQIRSSIEGTFRFFDESKKRFLRHRGGLLILESQTESDLFLKDSSFYIEEGFVGNGTIALRSFNFPAAYVVTEWPTGAYKLRPINSLYSPYFSSFRIYATRSEAEAAVSLYKQLESLEVIKKSIGNLMIALDNTAGTTALDDAPKPQAPGPRPQAPGPRLDDGWMQKFLKQRDFAHTGPNGSARLMALGDSLIEQLPSALAAELMPQIVDGLINAGISGDCLPHIIWRMRNFGMEKLQPQAVWILAGTNDLGHHNRSAAEIVALHETLWLEIKKRLPAAKLMINSLLPRQKDANHRYRAVIKSVNQQLRERCARDGHLFIDTHDLFVDPEGGLRLDLMPDELHLNEAGYQVLLTELAKTL